MALSVVDPVSPAIERTKKILFQPFEIGKWFILGFSAFLAELANGAGNGFNINGPGDLFNGGGGGPRGPGQRSGPDAELQQMIQWAQDHLALVVIIIVAIVLVGVLIGMVLTWLGCRGEFMFLDGVVHNRAEIKRPWREFASLGNSLFWFKFLFGLATFGAILLALGLCLLLAWPDIQNHTFGSGAIYALLLGALSVFSVSLIGGLVNLFLHHFVVPIMYLRGFTVMSAWAEFRTSMLSGRVGVFILYILFQIVIGICIGFIAFLATCLTLCIAALPYLGSVILLPLSVFHRSYTLHFIEQFGPEWQVFPHERPFPEETEAPYRSEPPDDRYYPG